MTALKDHAIAWLKEMEAAGRGGRVDALFAYLKAQGKDGDDPSVSPLEHALQTADLAQRESQQPHLVVASLLHDIGHLMLDQHGESMDQDWGHETVAAEALSAFFPASVTAPIQHHVAAKRLLCSLDPAYYEQLSDVSKRSIAAQGGHLRQFEADRLRAQQGMDDAIAVRRWDDRAWVQGVTAPNLDTYRNIILNKLL